jgi:hypothetical protein
MAEGKYRPKMEIQSLRKKQLQLLLLELMTEKWKESSQ